MAEGGSGLGPIDSSNFVYVPAPVKLLAAILLMLALLVSLGVSLVFAFRKENEEIAIYALSFAQLCTVVLVVGLVAVYSEREAGISVLQTKGDKFLDVTLTAALRRITIKDAVGAVTHRFAVKLQPHASDKTEILSIVHRDIFGRVYTCHLQEEKGENTLPFKMWVGLNVFRLFVIYFIDVQPQNTSFLAWRSGQTVPQSPEQFYTRWLREEVFPFTFGGAEHVGYRVNFELVGADDASFVSVWLTVEAAKDFLTNPSLKLFWSQDIAMMTESFLRTGLRRGLRMSTAIDPGPL